MSLAGKTHYLNTSENTVSSTVSGSFTQLDSTIGLSARLQGIYWTASNNGDFLQIKDSYGNIVYSKTVVGSPTTFDVDSIEPPLTVRTPLLYLDSSGGNQLVLYGEYLDYPD